MKLLPATLFALMSLPVLAAPPPAPLAKDKAPRDERRAERREEREKKLRMLAIVGIAEALELPDAEALKLGDRLKAFDDRKRPLHEQMFEAMHTVKQASEGDSASLAQLDAAVQKVFDVRVQLAALDKEEFMALAQGQTPQKRAKLAVFLAKFRHEVRAMAGGMGGMGGRVGDRDGRGHGGRNE